MPTWNQFMIPVLKVLSDGQTRSRRVVYDLVARETYLTEGQRAEVLDSGERRYENRISWAMTYLGKANALERPSRAHLMITESGQSLLKTHRDGLTEADLRLIEDHDDGLKKQVVQVEEVPASGELDPYELVERGVARINDEVARNLLVRLHSQDPVFFEQAGVDLVVAMG